MLNNTIFQYCTRIRPQLERSFSNCDVIIFQKLRFVATLIIYLYVSNCKNTYFAELTSKPASIVSTLEDEHSWAATVFFLLILSASMILGVWCCRMLLCKCPMRCLYNHWRIGIFNNILIMLFYDVDLK